MGLLRRLEPPGALYHGSSYDFEPGESVLPGSVHLGRVVNRPYRGDERRHRLERAYATPDESQAWDYAERSAWANGGRPRVHVVEPGKGLRADRHDPGTLSAKSLSRTAVIDTKPGRQGTFPELDWSAYADPSISSAAANHPTHEDISMGHPGGEFHRQNSRDRRKSFDEGNPDNMAQMTFRFPRGEG